METIDLSKRLYKAAEYTVEEKTIADIGSDHAYLPIYLIQQGTISKAIAGEVAGGPYKHAKEKVEAFHLSDQIDVRFGNGLDVLKIDEKIGTVFICGMGGALISEIIQEGINKAKLPSAARLVLQPNNAEKKVRQCLQDNRYTIIQETILEENNKIYEIIVAEYQSESIHYSKEELYFGPQLLKNKTIVFKKKWEQELEKSKQILKQLEASNDLKKQEEFSNKIKMIQKVIQ